MTSEIKTFKNHKIMFSDLINSITQEQADKMADKVNAYENEEERRHCFAMLKQCGISERYLDCSFDNFSVTNQLEAAMKKTAIKFCEDIKAGKQRSLILYGNFGAGKTHLATAILREMIFSVKNVVSDLKVHYTGNYVTVNEFVNQLQMSNWDRKSKDSLIKNATTSDVCVFDEMGRLANNRLSEPDVIFQLIDSVYRNKKNIVLITNLNLAEIQNVIGKAGISRMRSDDGLIAFDCSGVKDHRKA